jgi:protein NrfD
MTKKRTLQVLLALCGIALVIGAIGVVQRFLTGERFVGYGSYVPWGLWVALYFHGVGISGGVFAVGVIGYLLGIRGLRESLRVTVWVSVVALAVGLLAIWMDLGQQWRAYRIILDPSFTSMLAFNSWMYVFFFVASAICFLLTFNKASPSAANDRSGWLVPLLIPGLVMAIAYPSQSGAVFGVVDAKPYWTTSLMPVLFLASAVTAGAAVLLLVHTFLTPEDIPMTAQPLQLLRHVTAGGVIGYFVLEFAEFSVVWWSPISHARESVDLILYGPFWWVFWIVHLGGGLIALLLLMLGRSMPAIGTGAFLVALTFVSTRLNIVIPGQSVEQLKGLREAFTHPRLSYYYQATPNEYLVALFLGALGVALTYAGIVALKKFAPETEVKT